MSLEILLCPFCGDLPGNAYHDDYVICSCHRIEMPRTDWNRRFVLFDKNEDPVYNDSIITGWQGDHEVDECRLEFKEFCWWATEVQATFGVTLAYQLSDFDEIELVKEVK